MTALPQTGPRRRLSRPSWPVLVAIVLVIALVATLAGNWLIGRNATTLSAGTPVAVSRGNLTATINATGKIEPLLASELSFAATSGRVAEVLVAVGDTVAANAPLVTLDTRQLQAGLAAADAALAQAQADLAGLRAGATPEEIAAARAQVAAAQGSLQQTSGSVTSADVRAARLAVDQARARLATLSGTPNPDALARSEAAVSEAQASLDRQRSDLSATKEDARRAVEQRANALRDAQASYQLALDNKQRVLDTGKDPKTGLRLSDAAKQEYLNAADSAERTMQDADRALAQARIDYEAAKQGEITGLADAAARLASAQADLNALRNPNAEDLAAARAQLASAEARLAQLTGDQRTGALAAQQASLEAAQANLDKLLADPKATDLARAEARVAQAQAQRDQAQFQLDDATLRAPFAGVVAAVDIAPGEPISQGSPVTLFDISRYVVKVAVDEVDIAKVQLGQPVEVLLDAIGAPVLNGTVKRIAPQSQVGNAVTAYEVTLEVDPAQRPVKAGMTATAKIITAQRNNALSVPAAALRSENGQTVVSIVTTGPDGKQQLTTQAVTTGLRAGDQVEITAGVSEGQQVLVK